ncbi:hypothetical protein V1477_011699, partial [Vespula maculifrons]
MTLNVHNQNSIIDSTSQSKAGWFLRSSKSPGIEIHVPVGWYLSLTRRPNGTPSTVTGAQAW